MPPKMSPDDQRREQEIEDCIKRNHKEGPINPDDIGTPDTNPLDEDTANI